MTYRLVIYSLGDVTLQQAIAECETAAQFNDISCQALLDFSTDRPRVPYAAIDTGPDGNLTAHGANAYRATALAELIIQRATGQTLPDPHDRIAALEKENRRLTTIINSLPTEPIAQ